MLESIKYKTPLSSPATIPYSLHIKVNPLIALLDINFSFIYFFYSILYIDTLPFKYPIIKLLVNLLYIIDFTL